MILYVETNFILEIALLQEEAGDCDRIVHLCEQGKVELVIPAFSMVEPYETLTRRHKRRIQLHKELLAEFGQLARTQSYHEQREAMTEVTSLMVRSADDEKERLDRTLQRLFNLSHVIPLDSKILSSASTCRASQGLSPQDPIVYASVLDHVQVRSREQSCFITRNTHDFGDPDIIETLSKHNCRLLFSFRDGFRYISAIS